MGNEDDGISAERRSDFCPADRVRLKDAREDTGKSRLGTKLGT